MTMSLVLVDQSYILHHAVSFCLFPDLMYNTVSLEYGVGCAPALLPIVSSLDALNRLGQQCLGVQISLLQHKLKSLGSTCYM